MIGRLQGILLEKAPPELLVDCGGVGYEVLVPMSTYYDLPALGQQVSLLTHFIVREDAQILYGFATPMERSAFRQLIKVSGIGPRTALAVLSGLSVLELTRAVQNQALERIVKVPGIGKKTAERLLLELKGKFGEPMACLEPDSSLAGEGGQGASMPSDQQDIVQALLALGYSEKDANAAMKKLPQGVGVSEGIRMALRGLT